MKWGIRLVALTIAAGAINVVGVLTNQQTLEYGPIAGARRAGGRFTPAANGTKHFPRRNVASSLSQLKEFMK
jgi:hypothetical protein